MGILNASPDSFFADSRIEKDNILYKAEQMLNEGADLLDIGGYSTRPGAFEISLEQEQDRLLPMIETLVKHFNLPISVDTFRSEIARQAIAAGASLVNDVSAGDDDPQMLSTVASLKVPYIAMHKQGTPANMQEKPSYDNVVENVYSYLEAKMRECQALGISNCILDPGFGFGKTIAHNYQLLYGLRKIKELGAPLLIGISRKSMITRVLELKAASALNGSTVIHTIALMHGADILRVHDVSYAVEAIKLFQQYREANNL